MSVTVPHKTRLIKSTICDRDYIKQTPRRNRLQAALNFSSFDCSYLGAGGRYESCVIDESKVIITHRWSKWSESGFPGLADLVSRSLESVGTVIGDKVKDSHRTFTHTGLTWMLFSFLHLSAIFWASEPPRLWLYAVVTASLEYW